ncbi:MAG: type III-B CRISPR module RAMP protein Cmr6 [Caldisericia bacterium]
MTEIKINNRYLPEDSRQILPENITENEFKDFNFALIYNLPNIIEKDKKPEKIRINEEIDKYKWDSSFVSYISKRIEKSIELLKDCGFLTYKSDFYVSWRMVIGLGASHPQETSMTLHHIYGIPYIPGSAVKGVTRHYIILKFAEEYSKQHVRKGFNEALREVESSLDNGDKSLNITIKDTSFSDVVDILGTQSNVGKVIFFDAYPVDEIKLKLDVMTPHYGDYYGGEKPPADWLSPNPIKFLTVEKTRFKFCLASKQKNFLNKAEEWLKVALQNYGIGAKTAIGYGYFKI